MQRARRPSLWIVLVLFVFALALALPLTRGISPIDLGLDLSGGVLVTYRPDFSTRPESLAGAGEEELLALAKETIASRLYRKLDTVPEVVVRGDRTLAVSLPTHGDYQQVLELVGRTYRMDFRLVSESAETAAEGGPAYPYGGRLLELEPVVFSGDMLERTSIRVVSPGGSLADPQSLYHAVGFRFAPPHGQRFGEFTAANVGREMAILLDDEVQWVGVIESAIRGSGVLRGSYSQDEARETADMLRAGILPIALEVESLDAVGPSLGQELRERGLRALAITLAALFALIAFGYLHRSWLLLAGGISLALLLFNLAGMVALFGLSLDVVGIAGLILSVGMGMDAFIIVFEALEEKARALGARRLARPGSLVRGLYAFAQEGRVLFHANASTVVVVLLLLATERLASFAVFLLVGLAASVLTIFMTREVLARTRGLAPDLGLDTLGRLRRGRPGTFRFRRAYLALLGAALLLALLAPSLGWPPGAGLELGSDFQPGTQILLAASDPAGVDRAFERVDELLPGVELRRQRLGEAAAGKTLLTVGATLEEIGADRRAELAETFAAESVEVESTTSIDGKVSSRRLLGSLSVLGLSFLFLGLYFVFCQGAVESLFSRSGRERAGGSRTRWWVFAGVLLAVVLDVASMLAAAALGGIELNLPIVAALLAVIGYSVNDSVVLWGHIRARRARKTGETAAELVSASVDRILVRALLTTLSTIVPALAILAVGLEPLRDFAWMILVGTLAGTGSSLFLVSAFARRGLEAERSRRRFPPPDPA